MPDTKKRFGLLKILGILVVLIIALVIAIPFLIDANQFRPKLESELTDSLGRQVTVGNLKLTLLSGGVAADDIAIADDPAFSRSPFVQAKSLRVGVELKPLIFSRAVRVTGIELDQPEVRLLRSESGTWNFSSIGGSSGAKRSPKPAEPAVANRSDSPPDVSIASLKVTDGRVTVGRVGGSSKPNVYDKVQFVARDISLNSVFPFTLTAVLPGGGDVKVDGKAGPANKSDLSLTPFTASLAMKHFDLVKSGFVEAESGLAGIFDFTGSLASDGKQMQSKGSASADQLRVVKTGSPAGKPVSLDYALNYRPSSQSGTLNDAKITFGKATARLNGTYDLRGESAAVKMRLRGDDMPAEDLEALLPAVGATLPKGASLQGGILNADLTAEGPVQKLVTTGTLGLVNARLTGFDLGSKLAALSALAGIKSNSVTEIEKLASDMKLTPDGIQMSNFDLIVPALGQLTGGGNIGSGYALDFKMLARLSTAGGVVGGLARLAGVKGSNVLNLPFFIRGTTLNPSFVPDAKGVAQGLLGSSTGGQSKPGETDVNKGLGDALQRLLNKKKQ